MKDTYEDNGQRYEVRCTDGAGFDVNMGWSDQADGGIMVASVLKHDAWHSPVVIDRKGETYVPDGTEPATEVRGAPEPQIENGVGEQFQRDSECQERDGRIEALERDLEAEAARFAFRIHVLEKQNRGVEEALKVFLAQAARITTLDAALASVVDTHAKIAETQSGRISELAENLDLIVDNHGKIAGDHCARISVLEKRLGNEIARVMHYVQVSERHMADRLGFVEKSTDPDFKGSFERLVKEELEAKQCQPS